MFSTDVLFSLNEKSLFFFPKNINKELDVFNRYLFPLNEQSLFFFPNHINKGVRCFQQIFYFL